MFHSNLGLFDTNIEGAADKAHFSLILPEVVHRAGFTHIETHSSFTVRGDSFAFKGKLKGSICVDVPDPRRKHAHAHSGVGEKACETSLKLHLWF